MPESIDLELRAGEILGIAGLEGHGQEAMLLALWEQAHRAGEVRRIAGGRSYPLRSHRQAARRGVAYVPRDRRKASIFPSLPIIENFAVTTLEADTRAGLLSAKSRQRRFDRYREELGIRLGRPDDAITTLSGGNQQKGDPRALARHRGPRCSTERPDPGIDVGAKQDIYELLRESAEGAAVVLLSSELEEPHARRPGAGDARALGLRLFQRNEITREAPRLRVLRRREGVHGMSALRTGMPAVPT